MRRTYLALVYGGEGNFGVTFPDFPGCVSAGDTLAETIANATEALGAHIALMAQDGDPIPTPSIDVSDADDGVPYTVAAITVAVPGRTGRYNVTLDEDLVAEIDRRAGKGGRSRFLANAARAYLNA